MALFRKVEEDNIGATAVTLAVMEADDGIIVGRVIGVGIDEFVSTLPNDPPIVDAIAIASKLATANNVSVSVYDPQNRWQPAWGYLY